MSKQMYIHLSHLIHTSYFKRTKEMYSSFLGHVTNKSSLSSPEEKNAHNHTNVSQVRL